MSSILYRLWDFEERKSSYILFFLYKKALGLGKIPSSPPYRLWSSIRPMGLRRAKHRVTRGASRRIIASPCVKALGLRNWDLEEYREEPGSKIGEFDEETAFEDVGSYLLDVFRKRKRRIHADDGTTTAIQECLHFRNVILSTHEDHTDLLVRFCWKTTSVFYRFGPMMANILGCQTNQFLKGRY